MRDFDHERLEVYQRALDFVTAAQTIRAHLPAGNQGLSDQLHRAAMSIVLNIAEGAGEFARKEKVRFYRIARRSATECAAILDLSQRLGVSTPVVGAARVQLQTIVAMLVALAKYHEEKPKRS